MIVGYATLFRSMVAPHTRRVSRNFDTMNGEEVTGEVAPHTRRVSRNATEDYEDDRKRSRASHEARE